jgi:hypothetical protein
MGADEDSPPALRYCEEPSIENPVGPPIANGPHFVEETGQVSSTVARQEAGNVLQEKPTGSKRLSESEELKREDGSFTVEAFPLARDGQVLTGKAADQEIDRRGVVESRDVVVDRNVRPMRGEDAPLPLVQLALPRDAEPGPL